MSERTKAERFNPLQKIIAIGVAAVGVASFSLIRSCEARKIEPTLTNTLLEDSSTTTTTEVTETPSYWEKYGWTFAADYEAMRFNFWNNLGYNFFVAAGRCVVYSTTLHKNDPASIEIAKKEGPQVESGWIVIKNPFITQNIGEQNDEVSFTTFAGAQPITDKSGNILFWDTPYTSVIDGELQWGSIGIIPGQSEVLDTSASIEASLDLNTVMQPDYIEASTWDQQGNIRPAFTRKMTSNANFQPGEVITIPKSQEERVSQECSTPSYVTTDPYIFL